MPDTQTLANEARSKALTGIKRSAHTRARMSAVRIVRVLKLRPEAELEKVYREQLRRIQAQDAVRAAMSSDEPE